jgi:hypothetical protein
VYKRQAGYRPALYYYEIVVLFRKLFIIMSSVLLSVISPEA